MKEIKKRTTKISKLLDHLIEHGRITTWEAFNLYNVTRLSAFIFYLKKFYDIESIRERHTDSTGFTSSYVTYIYHGEKENPTEKI